jgi:hypothetical protein
MGSGMRLESVAEDSMAAIFYPAVLFQLYLTPFQIEIRSDTWLSHLWRPDPHFDDRVLSPSRIDPNNSFLRYFMGHGNSSRARPALSPHRLTQLRLHGRQGKSYLTATLSLVRRSYSGGSVHR